MGGSLLWKVTRRARIFWGLSVSTVRTFGKPKIFCIGCNKTGTTSLQKALIDLGVIVGEQWIAERLIHDWGRRDFRRLFRYCHTAQAFQDVPFSWPFTFQALDQRFPHSKFILTVRDTPEQWYGSMMSFYAALFGDHSLTHVEHLKAACYIHPGDVYDVNRLLYNTPDDDPFNQKALLARYNHHNDVVREYFRHRPKDLLVLNVAEAGAHDKLCVFLGKPRMGRSFPWVNKTRDHADARSRTRPADKEETP